jgi:hypothetical protein
LLLASIVWIVLGRRSAKEAPGEESTEGAVPLGKVPRVLFTFVVFLVVVAALYEARSFPYLGAIFPVAATVPAIFMAAIQIVVELRAPRVGTGPETRGKIKLALGYFAGLILYFLLIWLFGFGIATALFTFVFLYGWVKMRLLHTVIYTGSVVGVALLMSWLLNLYWPAGVLLGL